MDTAFASPWTTRRRLFAAFAASGAIHLALFLPSAPLSPPPRQPFVVHLSEPARRAEMAPFLPPPATTTDASAAFATAAEDGPRRERSARAQPLPRLLREKVLAELAREEFYPREAIAQGLEGRVVLLLAVTRDGRVSRIELARSSGHALLDHAALAAAARLQRLPGGAREVLLPVDFVLE